MLWERAMPAMSCLLSLKEKIAGMARSHSMAHSNALLTLEEFLGQPG